MYAAVVGQFSSERTERLGAALHRAGAEPAFYWDIEDAKAALAEEQRPQPRCIFLDSETVDVGAFVTWLRLQPQLFPIPALALVPRLEASVFQALHRAGVDDSVPVWDSEGVTQRTAQLVEFDPSERPRPDRGVAVIGHEDLARRTVLGRILRIAGFDVAFAESREDLATVVSAERQGDPVALLVVHHRLLSKAGSSESESLSDLRGPAELPTIVLGPSEKQGTQGDVGPSQEELRTLLQQSGVLVEQELAPPDNLAFLANELLLENVTNKRSSARLLHATLCSFREQGTLKLGYGVSYNLSAGGLYVRTLDTPALGAKLWIELAPPRESEAVHLRGEVMWGQKMSNRRASPPGFGLRFDSGACPSGDLACYLEAYHEVLG